MLPFSHLHLSVQNMVLNLHNVQYIAFSWISLTLVQDFSFVCPLLFTSNLSYTSNRIELFYNETRFQRIKYPTLLKFLHNTKCQALTKPSSIWTIYAVWWFPLSDKHISFRIFCNTTVKQRKTFRSHEIKKCLHVYWLNKCEQGYWYSCFGLI